jgi:hypothetical protein
MRQDETDLRQLEAALGSLAPRCGLDRDRVMFGAGRASAPRGWGWPAAAVASLTAAIFGFLLLARPTAQVVYVQVPGAMPAPPKPVPPPPPPPPGSEDSPGAPTVDFTVWQPQRDAVRLREHLLHWGLDGLPPPCPGPAESAETPARLLRSSD